MFSFSQHESYQRNLDLKVFFFIKRNAYVIMFLWIMQVFGLLTKPLIRVLLPSPKYLMRMLSSEPSTPKSFIVPLLGNGHESEADQSNQNVPRPTSLRMLLSTPSHTVHYYWRKFDNAFMRPVFGGRGFVPYVPGSPTEQNGHQWHWKGTFGSKGIEVLNSTANFINL